MGELAQRLADRDPGHVEPLRQLALDQAVAGAELAVDDQGPEPFADALADRVTRCLVGQSKLLG